MKVGIKTRAPKACVSCNARRVRCNANERNPCNNCAAADVPCVLRESRRGKHPRRPRKTCHSSAPKQQHTPSRASPFVGVSSLATTSSSSPPAQSPSETETRPAADAAPAPTAATTVSVDQACSTGAPQQAWDDHLSASQVLANLSDEATLRSAWPNQSPGGDTAHTSNGVPGTGTATAPSQDVLDSPTRQVDEEAVFLGESASIRHMHDAQPSPAEPCPPNRRFFHVPKAVRADSLTSAYEVERKQARLGRLEADGAFSFPPKQSVEKLLVAYFDWFHTCFAIVDEPDIWHQYHQDMLSPLLLQGMLFIGVMHCHEDDLPAIGLGSRHRAKFIFYNRAKDLYDAEIEHRTITVIQTLFLMSFWRAGALLQKDTRHWRGAAISLAQTKALHRSSSQDMTERIQKLRKRLWWSIYIRERQCAAALGLPNQVRDEDCDVEVLGEDDFEYAFGPSTSPTRAQESASYMVGMGELARMLGCIINRDFLPSKRLTHIERDEVKEALVSWRANLPACMRSVADGLTSTMGFHASMLHLACNNLFVLLYRSGCSNLTGQKDAVDGQVAIQAAARNTSIIEGMLAEGYMCHTPIYVITNIFNTLCIHTLSLRCSEGSRRYVAEHRAKLCLLALRELRKTWEVKNWILQLFFQHLDQPTAARLQLGEDPGEPMPGHGNTSERAAVLTVFDQDDAQMPDPNGVGSTPVCDATWPVTMSFEDAGHCLYTQIESRFVNGEGGALDWFMADMFSIDQPS
ncbi:hypothetical protein FDECE_13837 [Fusarium decemcellulare]|nr:hypothetical protein FDECE_13837 [Fusarium decemcellulare]